MKLLCIKCLLVTKIELIPPLPPVLPGEQCGRVRGVRSPRASRFHLRVVGSRGFGVPMLRRGGERRGYDRRCRGFGMGGMVSHEEIPADLGQSW